MPSSSCMPSYAHASPPACVQDVLTFLLYLLTYLLTQDVRFFNGDWAEESLLQAERALARLGVGRPDWLNRSYYDARVKAFA